MPFHSMYQMQPPPPPPMNMMSIPPPPPPPLGTSTQLMIDPNNFHQNYMYNQPPPQISPLGGYQYPGAKILISPSLTNPISPVNTSLKSQPNQMNSPTNNNSNYWIGATHDMDMQQQPPNEFLMDQQDLLNSTGNQIEPTEGDDMNLAENNQMNFDYSQQNSGGRRNTLLNDTNNRFQGNNGNGDYYKRKFNNNAHNNSNNFDADSGGYYNNHHHNQQHQQFNNYNQGKSYNHNTFQNKQSFNRIPTINSQRDRNEGGSAGYSNHNYTPNGRGGAHNNNNNGPKSNRYNY